MLFLDPSGEQGFALQLANFELPEQEGRASPDEQDPIKTMVGDEIVTTIVYTARTPRG